MMTRLEVNYEQQEQIAERSAITKSAEICYPKKHEELKEKYESQTLELVKYRRQAHYWKAQFAQLKSRYDELNDKVEKLAADLKKAGSTTFWQKV